MLKTNAAEYKKITPTSMPYLGHARFIQRLGIDEILGNEEAAHVNQVSYNTEPRISFHFSIMLAHGIATAAHEY
jgi:uncharacterized protein VirK/YbjX